MAELTKQALKVENNTEFPNNNNGQITPSRLRGFNEDMIDSLVDEISYNADSASWNQQIDALENFTASLGNGFVSTASFNSFTQSINSFTASVTASIVDLQNFSASLSGGFVTEGELQAATASLINQINTKLDSASFNTYTQSNDTKWNDLSTYTASNDTKWSNLGAQSGSWITESETGSFVTSAITASSLITASVNLNTITFTKGDASTFALTVDTGSGGGGGQTFANPSIESISGSVVLSALTFNSGAANLLHLSASAQNQANLVFKNNNNIGSTQISGSNNIFTNPTIPATGRVNYIGGSSNVFLNGQSQQLPTITGSAASVSGNRPTMNGNIIAGTQAWTINQAVNTGTHTYNNNLLLGTATWAYNMSGNTGTVVISNNIGGNSTMTLNSPSRSFAEIGAGASGSNALTMLNNASLAGTLTYNGPVSSSTHTISNNFIPGGSLTLNMQSSSRAITVGGNILPGNITFNDNTVFAPTLGSTNQLTANIVNGTTTINQRFSSSITLANNNINVWTISNDADLSGVSSAVSRTINIGGNALFGTVGNNIYFSGSALGTTIKAFGSNLMAGTNISASMIFTGGGEQALLATAVLGSGLNISGTSLVNAANPIGFGGKDAGSAFVGRWNAIDGNRNKTAETVFAVGTGNSGSAGITRKTGFLIDSGSNTFVEGTFNVSGSSTLSGSLYIQSGSTLPVSTGSAILTWDATTGQVKQASYSTIISSSVSSAEFWSTTTQSGSAGVSGSITFNNSGSFYNVSLVNGTQLTIANAGVYNIQFSAQIETSAGADTLWIWFKKNGTNIGDSASKAVLANNTAQIMTVNILDQANANDYYEIAYQNLNGHATVLAEAASGNIPAIPSVIATIFQIR